MDIISDEIKMFPLIKLAKKLKDGRDRINSIVPPRLFPLIKLAKKLKEGNLATAVKNGTMFPLIKLAKKLKA